MRLMTSFLLLASFLLHMVTLTIIYQLVKQIKALRQNNHMGTEELMEMYLQEIKEENRMLEANLDDTNNKHISGQNQKEKTAIKQNKETQTPNMLTDDAFIPSPLDPETGLGDTFETSQQSRILQLHDQGLSIEEIASQLHCGRTEVDLVIKLHPKTNNNA